MADEQKISRRDWFRLRVPYQDHERLGTKDDVAMPPVAEPPNYDGMDLSLLPKLHEALLSADQVLALFSDIEHCATDIQLLARGTTPDRDDPARYLHLVCEKFLQGDVNRLQIRYQWQGSLWIDTLERRPTGARLVRIAHA